MPDNIHLSCYFLVNFSREYILIKRVEMLKHFKIDCVSVKIFDRAKSPVG